MTGIPRDSSGELALPKVARHRFQSMKCTNCAWSTIWAKKHPNVMYIMKRLYARNKNEWKPIGWYCERCGSVIIDELTKDTCTFYPIPDPKITITRINI